MSTSYMYGKRKRQRLVDQVILDGLTIAEAAKKNGVIYNTAHNWVTAARKRKEKSAKEPADCDITVMMGASDLRKIEGTLDAYRTALLALINAA